MRTSTDTVAIGLRADQPQIDPVLRLRADVLPQLGRSFAERRDDRIDASVAIEIGEGAPRCAFTETSPASSETSGNVPPAFAKTRIRALFAVHGRLELLHPIVDMRVGGEQVLPAIVIEIEKPELPSRCASRLSAPTRERRWHR